MSNHVYKIIQLAGSSSTSIEDAIETAIAKAAKTVRNVDWFEVSETRGQIQRRKGSALSGPTELRLQVKGLTCSVGPRPLNWGFTLI